MAEESEIKINYKRVIGAREVEDPETEITLEEAQSKSPDAQIGDILAID